MGYIPENLYIKPQIKEGDYIDIPFVEKEVDSNKSRKAWKRFKVLYVYEYFCLCSNGIWNECFLFWDLWDRGVRINDKKKRSA